MMAAVEAAVLLMTRTVEPRRVYDEPMTAVVSNIVNDVPAVMLLRTRSSIFQTRRRAGSCSP